MRGIATELAVIVSDDPGKQIEFAGLRQFFGFGDTLRHSLTPWEDRFDGGERIGCRFLGLDRARPMRSSRRL